MSDGRKPSVAFALGLGLVMTACSMSSTPPAEPSPEFAPREVVDIVLTALRSNNEPAPDTGIATAFAFASPGNRESTGPLPRFIQMIEAGYAPLIDHRSAEIGPPVERGDRLVFPVRIYPQEGPVRLYLFVLAEQADPACTGCWMTDGVVEHTDLVTPELSI